MQDKTWYLRRYPTEELVAQLVGYSTIQRSRTGLEESLNDYLTASNADLTTLLDRARDTLTGSTRQGNDVVTTIRRRPQEVAMDALSGLCGSVVALDPRTGRLLVSASSPSYDPNLAESDFRQITQIQGACTPAAPLVNRATGDLFIPGSTFKVVTATAALDSGEYTPESRFDDPGYCIEYGDRVSNYSDQGGPQVYGNIDFGTAMENSVNSVFCNIGKELGPDLILDYAERYGFYEDPPLETPSEERLPSGLYNRGKLYRPENPQDVDPGRLAFGQERLLATPLQMAMVVSAVGNGGVLMEPQVVERIVSPKGKTISRLRARRVPRGHEAADGSRPHRHDDAGRVERYGDVRADSRHRGRGQDRHRRDGSARSQPHVVHRLCSRRRSRGRDRGRALESERDGRFDRGSDRKGRHGGDSGRQRVA